jgi:tripeptidyl-peptidase-1
LSAATLASSRAVPDTATPHETITSWAAGTERKLKRLPADTLLPMRITLKQQNLGRGEQWLMDVSDPDSSQYGQHWTQEDIIAAFSPPTRLSTPSWRGSRTPALHPTGSYTPTTSSGWSLTPPPRKPRASFTHNTTGTRSDGRAAAGCDEYYVPPHLRDHVDFPTPAVMRAALRVSQRPTPRSAARASNYLAARQANSSDLSNCYNVVTPACVRALYNFPIQASDASVDARTDSAYTSGVRSTASQTTMLSSVTMLPLSRTAPRRSWTRSMAAPARQTALLVVRPT